MDSLRRIYLKTVDNTPQCQKTASLDLHCVEMAAACRQNQNVVPRRPPITHVVQEARLAQILITKCAVPRGVTVPQRWFKVPYVETELGTYITTAVWTRGTSAVCQPPPDILRA